MMLALSTWPEVASYLERSSGIILPVGSTEQHGPIGLVGTDALCASAIAEAAAKQAGAMVAPVVAYTPAPFNMAFPGTVSVSEATFNALFEEIAEGLYAHGFKRLYILNAHGANLAPMHRMAKKWTQGAMRIRSWWELKPVHELRGALYGAWEGLHATPAEVAITQALFRTVPAGAAADPPRQLDPKEIAARAGDNHGSSEQHRREFPDGRVGSHSALATPADGQRLLKVAAAAVAADYKDFITGTTV